MKLRVLLILFLAVASTYVYAQSEFKTNFRFCLEESDKLNVHYLTQNIPVSENSYSETIKVDISKHNYTPSSYFAQSIFNFLINGDLNAYSISDNKRLKVSEIKEIYSSIDTIVTFDPWTYAENIKTVKTINWYDCNCYKIEQLWKKNKQMLITSITVIVPLKKIKDEEIELLRIPINQSNHNSFINNPSLSWIKVNEEFIPNSTKYSIKEIIWDNPKKNKIPIYYTDSNILTENERIDHDFFVRALLSTSKDTVISFEPETYKETVNIVEDGPRKYSDVKYLKINQLIYIDDEAKSIGSKLLGIAPLIESENIYKQKITWPLYQIIFDKME